jgi:hypothetical protein
MRRSRRPLLGALLGGAAGYLYYYVVTCKAGGT